MPAKEDLVAAAQTALGKASEDSDETERVLAAGVFGVQDSYAAVTAGGVVGGAAASAVTDSAVAASVGSAAGIHAARDVNAASKGLTVRVLVAVTAQRILLFGLPDVGNNPGELLRTFTRATTVVTVKRFGVSRRLSLVDEAGESSVALTGSTAFFSAYAAGAKAVLAELRH